MQERPRRTGARRYGGRFEPIEEVGSGGMGSVFRARDLETGAEVALKVLHDRAGPSADRFHQESALLSELRHAAIVRYVAHGVTPEGEHYLAMEWLDGHSLEERLTEGALSLIETVALGARIADALALLHRRGIVHRDVKPENLFLPDGHLQRVKLLDFGIARRIHDRHRITRAGATLGTPMYMSPEQARGQDDIDHAADVFSLGCVLYECLTGRPPFVGDTAMAVLAKICLEPPVRAGKLRPGIPPSIEALVGAMLAKDRRQRPTDLPRLARELTAIEERLRARGERLAEEEEVRAKLRTPSALGAGEERLFSVAMVAMPRAGGAPAGAPQPDDGDPTIPDLVTLPRAASAATNARSGTHPAVTPPRPRHTPGPATPAPAAGLVERLRQALQVYDVKLDRLYNSALVITQTGDGAPVEQAVRAARAALTVKALAPAAALALCTARADGREPLPIGQVLERAGRLLVRASAGQIELDDASAALLDARFEIARVHEGGAQRLHLLFEKGLREPPRTVLGQELPCVGRDRELAQLEALFDEVSDERVARVALVTAPAGGGKSRVRHEFLERVQGRGERLELLIARGDPLRAGAPFGLLGAALRSACNLSGTEDPATQRKRLLAHVGRNLRAPPGEPAYVQRVAAFLGEVANVPFPDAGLPTLTAARRDPRVMADQVRVAFLDWLEAELDTGAVLLLFEDLHWGDLPSVELADAALRVLAERPLMVLAFARPELGSRFPGLWEERGLETIALPPLTQKAGQRLARAAWPDGPEETLAALVARSEGNPFFLEELLRSAIASGPAFSTAALPLGVLGVLHARLDALGEEGKRVLRAASIFGQSFRRAGVSALLDPDHDAETTRWLDILSEQEVLFPRTVGNLRELSFRHALMRDAAYATLTPADRQRGHLAAGRWLEQHGDGEPNVLAQHFELGGDSARAAEHWARAAEAAFQAGDLRAALLHGERGLANGAAGALRGRILLTQVRAHNWLGEHAEVDGLAEQAAAALDGHEDQIALLAERVIASGQRARFDLLDQTIAALLQLPEPSHDVAWARALLRAASYLVMAGHRRRGESLRETALAGLAPGVATPAADDHMLLGNLATLSAQPLRGLRHFDAARQALEAEGRLREAVGAAVNLASGQLDLGRTESALAILDDCLARADRVGAAVLVPVIQVNLALAHLRRGDPARARAHAAPAESAARAHGDTRIAGIAATYLALALLGEGRVPEAQMKAEQAVTLLGALPGCRALAQAALARALWSGGQLDAGLELAERAHAALDRADGTQTDGVQDELFVRTTWASLLVAAGRQDEARAVVARCRSRFDFLRAQVDDPAARDLLETKLPEALELARLGQLLAVR